MEASAARAEELRQSGQHAELVAFTLGLWTQSRAPEVADALDVFTAEALSGRAPSGGARAKEEFQKLYLAVAREPSPLDTGWLAANLTRLVQVEPSYAGILDGGYARKKHRAFFERLDVLKPRVPDPRIAKALVAFLVEAPYSAWDRNGARHIYGPVLELLVAAGDPRQAPALQDLLAHPKAERATIRDELADTLPVVIAQLQAVPVLLPEPERERWRHFVPERPKAASGADGDALLAAVHAEPDSDEVRLVYADWLQERGDPRGEFVMLQVRAAQGRATAADAKRARALLREHEDAWLGGLANVLTGTSFERGFLAAAVVAQNAAATAEAWEVAPRSKVLATVHSLEQGRGNAQHYQALVCSEHATNLRRVEIPGKPMLEALLGGPPRLVEELTFKKLVGKDGLARVAKSAAFPGLEHVRVPAGADPGKVFDQLRASGLCERLARLSLSASWDSNVASVLAEVRRGVGDRALPPEVRVENFAAWCTLRAAGSALEATVRDEWGTMLDAFLDAGLPLATLTVSTGAKIHDRLAPSLERAKALRSGGVHVTVEQDSA
jgi:uncharacterized protein (TIGR02996 family)